MKSTELTSGWTLTATGGDPDGRLPEEIPAAVPGSSHVDLMSAGLIPDPFLDGNEFELTWLFGVDWRYRTTLDPARLDLSPAAPDERVELVFEGIDTVATISVGTPGSPGEPGTTGRVLGETRNMHRTYRFDVSDVLTGGPLQLSVDLASATTYAEAEKARLGPRPAPYSTPFNYLRKMACSFGWDWGPDLRTAGLWKPVRLERWRTARIASVRPLVTVDPDGTGRVELHVEVERTGEPVPLVLKAGVAGSSAMAGLDADQTGAALTMTVPDAELWWPVGYGEQPLSDLELTLHVADEEELDRWQRRIGFRTVELDTGADEFGSAYRFSINKTPVFVKGANWIPDDHFLTRITPDRLARRLDQAVEANLNLIRVWGGGIYETDAFYEACDERGLLVWQDFLLACAAYPEEEPLAGEIEAEARDNVVRLMPHPSLIHWNGGNENLWGHEDWGWQEQLGSRSWGESYARELFPGSSPSWTPPGRTATTVPAHRGRAPPSGIRTTPTTAATTSGRCGTGSTTPRTAARSRASVRSSASRDRLPGGPWPNGCMRSTAVLSPRRPTPRRTRTSSSTRRPTTATPSWITAWRPIWACRATSPTGTGPGS